MIMMMTILAMVEARVQPNWPWYAQVLETLLEMRTQRMGLIQTEDQLRFSVEALILALKRLQGEVGWLFIGC